MTNSLEHYGILGMKWGVRRYQPYPKGKHGTFLGQTRDEDIRISKGAEAYRVQSDRHLKGEGQTYISLTKGDHIRYLSAASNLQGGVAVDAWVKGEKPDLYSVRMQLSEDIIAPSYQKTMEAFIKTVSDSGGAKAFARDISAGSDQKEVKAFEKEFLKKYSHLSVDSMRDEAYLEFTKRFMRNSEAKNKFFSNLESQGYNAVVDDWDKKFGEEGSTYETPIIVFKQEKVLKETGSKKLSDSDISMFSNLYEDTLGDIDEALANHAFYGITAKQAKEKQERAKAWRKWRDES